ncbi:hypothetical protein ACA910_009530 [Epithemia clementina (nom. ined.)]
MEVPPSDDGNHHDEDDGGWLLSSSSPSTGKTGSHSAQPQQPQSQPPPRPPRPQPQQQQQQQQQHRPMFGLMVMEQNGTLGLKDITVLHSKWDAEKTHVLIPGQRRLAIQWQSAHTYFSHDGHEMFICNICGRDLKLSGSVSAVTAHLTHKHPDIKAKMDEIERAQPQHGAVALSLPGLTTNTNTNNSLMMSSKKRPNADTGATMSSRSTAALSLPGSKTASASLLRVSGGDGNDSKNLRSSTLKQPTASTTTTTAQSSSHNNNNNNNNSGSMIIANTRPHNKVSSAEVQHRAQISAVVGLNLPLSHTESPWHRLLLHSTVHAARVGASAIDLELTVDEVRQSIYTAYQRLREYFQERLSNLGNSNKDDAKDDDEEESGDMCTDTDQTHPTIVLCGAMERYKPSPHATYSTFRVQWIEDFELFSAVLVAHASKGQQHEKNNNFETKLLEWETVRSSIKYLVTSGPSSWDDDFTSPFINDDGKTKSECERITCLDYILQQVAMKAFEGILGIADGDSIWENEPVSDYVNSEPGAAEGDNSNNQMKCPLLHRARSLVRYFQGSIEANEELMKIADQLRSSRSSYDKNNEEDELNDLVQDVSHQWLTTLTMLERILALREAITIYVNRQWSKVSGRSKIRNDETKRRPPKLSEEEWEQMDQLCLALSPLRFAPLILSGYHYPTAPLVPLVIYLIYRDLEKIHGNRDYYSETVLEATHQMLHTLDRFVGDFCSQKYQPKLNGGNPTDHDGAHSQVKLPKAFLYAHALDPRFKRLAVFPLSVREMIWDGVLEEMVNLSPTILKDTTPSSTAKETEAELGKNVNEEEKAAKNAKKDLQRAGSVELENLFQLYAHKQQTTAGKKQPDDIHANDWNRKCEVELQKYRDAADDKDILGGEDEEEAFPKIETEVLREWWGKSGHVQYPILWRLVQRFFAVAATAAPPGRAFAGAAGNAAMDRACRSVGSDGMLPFLQENLAFLMRDGRFFLTEE